MLRRPILVPLISAVALLLLAPPASAAPRVPNAEPVVFADPEAGEVCSFNILITYVARQDVRATLPSGLQVITGPATATVTNEETGETAVYNISGPGKLDPATNRLTLFGQSLILQSTAVGDPFLITTSGQVGFIINRPIDRPLRGHVSHDVCTELA